MYSLLHLQHQEQCLAQRGHSENTYCCRASASPEQPQMAAFGHTFPFYAGPKPTFPTDTTLAVIVAIFLTSLATFIIILPGIRGKMVRNKTNPADPSPRETLTLEGGVQTLWLQSDSGERV